MHISVLYFRLNIRNWGWESQQSLGAYISINTLDCSLTQRWLHPPLTAGRPVWMGPLVFKLSPHIPSARFFGLHCAFFKMFLSSVHQSQDTFHLEPLITTVKNKCLAGIHLVFKMWTALWGCLNDTTET